MYSEEFIKNLEELVSDSSIIKKISIIDKLYNQEEMELIKSIKSIITCSLPIRCNDEPYEYVLDGKEQLEVIIKTLADKSNDCIFKAKVYDMLWIKHADYSLNEKAYNNFIILINDKDTLFDEKVTYIIRVFKLLTYDKKKINNTKIQELNNIIVKVIKDNMDDTLVYTINLLNILYNNNFRNTNFIYSIIDSKIKLNLGEYIIKGYIELFEKIYLKEKSVKLKSQTSDKKIIRYRRKLIDYYLTEADCVKSYISKEALYKEALKILNTIKGTTDERREISLHIKECQKNIFNSSKKQVFNLDISQRVQQILKNYENKDLDNTLYDFALNMKLTKQSYIDIIPKNLSIVSIIGNNIKDENGRTICYLPPLNNSNLELHAINNIYMYHNVISQMFIEPSLHYIKNKFNINDIDKSIDKLIDKSIFVPKNRRISIKKGLLAGFNYDFLTSLSILLPQIENSIRCIAENNGDIVTKTNEEGVDEFLTLHKILSLENIKEYLGDDMIFNMKAVFTSKYGLNTRNRSAHGILDDEYYNTHAAMYTWWFILKLCCTQDDIQPKQHNL